MARKINETKISVEKHGNRHVHVFAENMHVLAIVYQKKRIHKRVLRVVKSEREQET